eukprot:jgi/Undpi1/7837/HiC_scaffold_23.g10310.m2
MAHHAKAKWQTNCHGLCLRTFEDGDIVIETDFIEKYTHVPQADLTCARHETTTLMVAIVHFCPQTWEGGGRVHLSETWVFASADPTHDFDFHLHALKQIADYYLDGEGSAATAAALEDGRVPRMHMFTDGCAKQYKGRRNFRFLSSSVRELGFIVEHHFAATSHFKGCHDGIGGVIKNAMRNSERLNKVITGAAGVVKFVDEYFAKIGNKDLAEYFATWSAYRIRRVHAKLIEFNAIYRPTRTLQGIKGTRDIYVFVGVNKPRPDASTSTRLGRNAEIPDVVKKDWSLARAVHEGVSPESTVIPSTLFNGRSQRTMYVAFFNSGCQDSQVVLALENSAGFVRSQGQNGASVFSTNLTNSGSGTACWVGLSSRRRAWAMEGSFENDVPSVDLVDGVRNAGLLFLDLDCEAIASLSAADDFDGIDRSRVFAYDGVHAAIMVTEGRTRVFCQQVSSGLYDLGVSINPRIEWRNALGAAASSLFVDSMEGAADGTLGGFSSPSERFSLSAWSSVVHMAPNRVAVHQRCTGGATKGLSAHYFRTMVENDPMQHGRKNSVQDAFVIFGRHSHDAVRLGPHPRALVHGKHRPSKPQARVAYESATAPKRHKKDPNRPRGYISAFNFFVKDKRPTYVQNRPNAQGHSLEHNNEINKILGKVWKMATEHEKKTYEEKATADKVRYLKEMNAYRPPEGYERIAPR